MRIVIAPDSFKECLPATKVAEAISKGIKQIASKTEIVCIPMADGGEGTVEALATATSGRIVSTSSVDALNRPIQSFYGILGNGQTAVIEMAAASGIELLSPEERNPLVTSTFGTGLLLKAAMDAGFAEIILGIGGSATNDGGAGMAQALGFELLDKNGNQISPGGGSLGNLHHIDRSKVHPLLRNTKITVACDVQNPLLGINGATRVYGPQKGASAEMIEILEQNMSNFAKVILREFGADFSTVPGAGAAGGLGCGLMAFCNAIIRPGFDLISELTNLEKHIRQADLVFTGEGKIDSQTAFGKTISGVSQLGKKYGIPVIALSGILSGNLETLYNSGLTSAFAIANQPMSIEESKVNAAKLLARTSEQIVRMMTRTL